MSYRIGLDIGIASVGWCVLEHDEDDNPVRIMDWGVRCFEKAEQPKTGESLAAPRRGARSARRRLRRRKHRLERIKYLLEQNGIISTEKYMERYHCPNLPNVYQLRAEGLDRVLTCDELAQVLLHIAKHRGFKSSRKSEMKEDKETGAVLTAIKENEALFADKHYRTIGEMMYLDEAFKKEVFNSIDANGVESDRKSVV